MFSILANTLTCTNNILLRCYWLITLYLMVVTPMQFIPSTIIIIYFVIFYQYKKYIF